MKKRTKCYLYTQVSTSMQVDGYSLDAQIDKQRQERQPIPGFFPPAFVKSIIDNPVYMGKIAYGRPPDRKEDRHTE